MSLREAMNQAVNAILTGDSEVVHVVVARFDGECWAEHSGYPPIVIDAADAEWAREEEEEEEDPVDRTTGTWRERVRSLLLSTSDLGQKRRRTFWRKIRNARSLTELDDIEADIVLLLAKAESKEQIEE
jgi:hypothetical protein